MISEAGWNVGFRLTESQGVLIYLAERLGRRVLWEAALPYVTIDHQPQDISEERGLSAHGPIWAPLGARTLAGDIHVDRFRGGFEITADFLAGPYRYTQMWRFFEDGRMAPWLTIHGAGIHDSHAYHPCWRFDFDLNGKSGDHLERFENGAWKPVTHEGWFPAEAGPSGPLWRQRGGGLSVSIRPHAWEDAELFAIRYRDDDAAPLSPHSQDEAQPYPAAYAGAEPLAGEDVTLWYVGHIHYDAAFPFTAGPWLQVS